MRKYDWRWLAVISAYSLAWVVLLWLTISTVVIGFGCVEKWNVWVILWYWLFRRN